MYYIMPRTQSNSSIKTRTSLPTGRSYSAPPPPAPPSSLQTPSPTPSFLSTMGQGLALGMGSSMGHRAVDAVLGAPTPKPSVSTPTSTSVAETSYACNNNLEGYVKCIHEQPTVRGLQVDTNTCNKLYDDYLHCISKAESSDHHAFVN